MKNLTVLAIGGNAIDAKSYEEEGRNILKTLKGIETLIRAGPLVINHGNGPQVGKLMDLTHDPLGICTAQTQGSIGSLISLNLKEYLEKKKITKPIISMVTHVVINKDDKTLSSPIKPIGDFITKKKEVNRLRNKGHKIEKDPAGRGWRRIVPSPKPIALVEEIEAVKILLKKDNIVILGGGGGIPTYKSGKRFVRVEAVIDKDHTSSLIASQLKAETLILLTEVETVKLNFGKKNETSLKNLTIRETKKLAGEGHFKTGMLSKTEAAINFLENGGKKAIIGHIFKLKETLEGKTGTLITKEVEKK